VERGCANKTLNTSTQTSRRWGDQVYSRGKITVGERERGVMNARQRICSRGKSLGGGVCEWWGRVSGGVSLLSCEKKLLLSVALPECRLGKEGV